MPTRSVTRSVDAPFPRPAENLCGHCRAVFDSMDLSREVCEQPGRQALPSRLRQAVLADIEQEGNQR